ncbi:hypothetical protein R69608_05086 [Paraburkholderia nemoris]|uniref:PIN domain-containing protein n=1 Tax=Paraburkholderia nemoris TaxID=2793076 RepID=UPI0019136C4B|nr:PIN domain-containing protein [Paraburkholderia nemoris]MBK5149707.1 DUF4935 domain-containing protein [Burkholderia sp. R-69608]CAE6938347.1 hypothetical protein R69608_05086 [Paraburkholderia nemoris]
MAKQNSNDSQTLSDLSVAQVFRGVKICPSPSDAFLFSPDRLETVFQNADVVLDTNVLLLPYKAGTDSFSEIIAVFSRLKGEGRLFVPSQVAREFVKNRPTKIGEMFQGIFDQFSKLQIPAIPRYPLLEDIPQYKELLEVFDELTKVKARFRDATGSLTDAISEWDGSDPVSIAYQKVFDAHSIIQLPIESDAQQQEILKEMQARYSAKIPPGYKDSSKDDGGVGDYIIWREILQLAEKKKRHLVFVSGEEKADWQHRAASRGFAPRYELLDEFRRKSEGKSFHIRQLSELLELCKADAGAVAEVRKEEQRVREATSETVTCPECETATACTLGEAVGSSAVVKCQNCLSRFHVNRTRNGVGVFAWGATGRGDESTGKNETIIISKQEIVACPSCNSEISGRLPTFKNATRWLHCAACESDFPIHRMGDGGVYVSRAKNSPQAPDAG